MVNSIAWVWFPFSLRQTCLLASKTDSKDDSGTETWRIIHKIWFFWIASLERSYPSSFCTRNARCHSNPLYPRPECYQRQQKGNWSGVGLQRERESRGRGSWPPPSLLMMIRGRSPLNRRFLELGKSVVKFYLYLILHSFQQQNLLQSDMIKKAVHWLIWLSLGCFCWGLFSWLETFWPPTQVGHLLSKLTSTLPSEVNSPSYSLSLSLGRWAKNCKLPFGRWKMDSLSLSFLSN